jgi:hypothetical protein
MRSAFVVFVGALALAGCGAEAGKDIPEEEATDDVGVSTSALTNCERTELMTAKVQLGSDRDGWRCEFRLMMNNFACDEGIVGQASTEVLDGSAQTFTRVATKLFDQSYEGINGWASPATIATQWGHAFASSHFTQCRDAQGGIRYSQWKIDPFNHVAWNVY